MSRPAEGLDRAKGPVKTEPSLGSGDAMLEVTAIDRALFTVLLANLWAFAVFGFDKSQARAHGSRVPERLLLLFGLTGGLGAWMGQHILRHKTRKEPFRTLLGVAITIHVAGVAGLFYVLLR